MGAKDINLDTYCNLVLNSVIFFFIVAKTLNVRSTHLIKAYNTYC